MSLKQFVHSFEEELHGGEKQIHVRRFVNFLLHGGMITSKEHNDNKQNIKQLVSYLNTHNTRAFDPLRNELPNYLLHSHEDKEKIAFLDLFGGNPSIFMKPSKNGRPQDPRPPITKEDLYEAPISTWKIHHFTIRVYYIKKQIQSLEIVQTRPIQLFTSHLRQFRQLQHLCIIGYYPSANFDSVFATTNSIQQPFDDMFNIKRLRQLVIQNITLPIQLDSILSCAGNAIDLTEIHINNCSIEGSIPNVFERLQKLQVFNVADNNLTGSLPHSLLSSLTIQIIDIRNNASMTGTIVNDNSRCKIFLEGTNVTSQHRDTQTSRKRIKRSTIT